MGFAYFYRRFITNFSQVAAPLTSLTGGKGTRPQWTPEADLAFQKLKHAFCSAPVLQQPCPEDQFEVEVDASETVIRAILIPRDGPPTSM